MLMEKQHLQESLLSEKMGKKQNEKKETEKGIVLVGCRLLWFRAI